MVDVQALTAQLLAALATVPDISEAYDGYVPAKVPETDGYIDPYLVLWAGSGENPQEVPAHGQQDTGTLVWDFQTTAVAASASACRGVDLAIRDVLVNLRLGTGTVRRNPEGFNQNVPYLDTQTTPSRFMLPRQWRLITN